MAIQHPQWKSLGHLLREQAQKIGHKPLLRFADKTLSFSQVEQLSNRLAVVLAARKVQKGGKVAVVLPNGFEFPLAWLALAKLGAAMVPVNVQYQATELEYVLNHSQATLALVGRDQESALLEVRARCASLREVVVFAPGASLYGEMEQVHEKLDLNASQHDLLNLQYTSGTTGFPKACLLTHQYWLQLGQEMLAYAQVRGDDVDLTAQPFYYMDPQWNLVLCMMAGIPLVVLPRFSASTFWRSVKDHGVTFFYLIATMPVYLLKQPQNPKVERGHHVRLVICSGIVPQLHETFERRWGAPWREAYGSTESGGDLRVSIEQNDLVGSGSVGTPFPGKECKIVDEQGNAVPAGKVGELLVRGDPMMLGYYNDPQASAKKIRDGWLHSGDLFRQDERGYYYIVGRLKDMVRRSGENISAAEVEGTLCQHPAVQAVAVVPVADELRGEEVKAFVQLQPDATLTPQALLDFAKTKLAAFKLPRYVEFVDRFEMTPSERIIKRVLLEAKSDQRQGAYDAVEKQWRG